MQSGEDKNAILSFGRRLRERFGVGAEDASAEARRATTSAAIHAILDAPGVGQEHVASISLLMALTEKNPDAVRVLLDDYRVRISVPMLHFLNAEMPPDITAAIVAAWNAQQPQA